MQLSLRAACTRGAQAASRQRGARTMVATVAFMSPAAGSGEALKQTLDAACRSQKARPLAGAVLQQSLQLYLARTPSTSQTVEALLARGVAPHTLAHDHFAYRTLGLPGLGIAGMAAVLKELGYTQQEDNLQFPIKKLRAAWFAHNAPPSNGNGNGNGSGHHFGAAAYPMPRIFVSEIKVEELSAASQAIIRRYAAGVALGPAEVTAALLTGQLPWPAISRDEYAALVKESDYAAWVMVHGYALNHTALAVHPMGLSLGDAADAAAGHGLTMNQDGGLIKLSPDGLLRQCSSMSDSVDVAFGGGKEQAGAARVPGAYIELIERLPLPQFAALKAGELHEWHRRDGFEVGNAQHLFTSTRTA